MGFHPEKMIRELNELAWTLRMDAIETVYTTQSGHPGGSLSAAEEVMKYKK